MRDIRLKYLLFFQVNDILEKQALSLLTIEWYSVKILVAITNEWYSMVSIPKFLNFHDGHLRSMKIDLCNMLGFDMFWSLFLKSNCNSLKFLLFTWYLGFDNYNFDIPKNYNESRTIMRVEGNSDLNQCESTHNKSQLVAMELITCVGFLGYLRDPWYLSRPVSQRNNPKLGGTRSNSE